MANIRFVKPPNDNRIRQFPTSALPSDVIHIATSSNDVIQIKASTTDQVLHITTPKRKTGHVPPWDLFITSKTESSDRLKSPTYTTTNNINNESNSVDQNTPKGHLTNDTCNNQTRQSFQECLSDSPVSGLKNKKCRYSIENSLSSSEDVQSVPAFKKLDKNGNFSESIHDQKGRHYDAQENDSHKNMSHGSITAGKQTQGSKAARADSDGSLEDDKLSKCPIIHFYRTIDDAVDSSLSDVLDEELDQLPDVSIPGGSHTPPAVQQTSNFQQQQQQQQHHHQQQQQQQQQLKQQITSKCRQELRRRAMPQYKFLESSKPMRRSVSDAALANDDTPSFFKSLNTAFEFDDDLDSDDTSFDLDDWRNLSHLNPIRKLNSDPKTAWEGSQTTGTESRSGSESALGEGKERKSRLSMTPVEMLKHRRAKTSRSESCEYLSLDRLRIRRCALADPEKMIMSQDRRERLQKDVEKRKSSMMRKVSQFLNVQLGLNKEEDLI